MKVIVNGQERKINNAKNVFALLRELKLNPDITAVEKNGEIIDKTNYETENVNHGDKFELIRFMGGG